MNLGAAIGRQGKQFFKRWLQSIGVQFGAIIGAYGLLIDLYLLLRWLTGEQLSIIAFFNNSAPLLLLGSIACFVLGVLPPFRSVWMLYNLPGAIVFLIWYGGLFLRIGNASVPENGTELSVVTFNMTGRTNLDEKIALIERLNADIVGTQETASRTLSERLSGRYEYRADLHNLGVYSHYPIGELETIAALDSSSFTQIVRTTVTVDGINISLYIAHFIRPTVQLWPIDYGASGRSTGVAAITAEIENDENPILLLCDCNMSDQTQDHNAIEAFLTDAWKQRGVGLGLTAPSNPNRFPIPLIRGDYVWFSDAFTALNIEVVPDSATSDHYPVMATLFFEPFTNE